MSRHTLHGAVMREAAATGRSKPRPLLTEPQRRWLGRANGNGLIELYGANGYHLQNFERVMKGLIEKGYVTECVHGGYQITDAGRSAAGERG